MLYVPLISDYKPFYIQQEGSQAAINILDTYKVIVKTHDYPLSRKIKEPYRHSWFDQHGDEEYLGALYYEAFTFSAECAMFARDGVEDANQSLRAGIRAFEDFLSQGGFSVYDSWTGFGFKDVRLVEVSVGSNAFDYIDGRARVIFNVTFKVNDPATRIVYNNGSLVEA